MNGIVTVTGENEKIYCIRNGNSIESHNRVKNDIHAVPFFHVNLYNFGANYDNIFTVKLSKNTAVEISFLKQPLPRSFLT